MYGRKYDLNKMNDEEVQKLMSKIKNIKEIKNEHIV